MTNRKNILIFVSAVILAIALSIAAAGCSLFSKPQDIETLTGTWQREIITDPEGTVFTFSDDSSTVTCSYSDGSSVVICKDDSGLYNIESVKVISADGSTRTYTGVEAENFANGIDIPSCTVVISDPQVIYDDIPTDSYKSVGININYMSALLKGRCRYKGKKLVFERLVNFSGTGNTNFATIDCTLNNGQLAFTYDSYDFKLKKVSDTPSGTV